MSNENVKSTEQEVEQQTPVTEETTAAEAAAAAAASEAVSETETPEQAAPTTEETVTVDNRPFSESVDFSQLEGMTKEEQLAWLDGQMAAMSEQGKACAGFEAAVTMDKIGLDMSKVREDGSYNIPLQSMLYAEGVNLGVVNAMTGAPNMDKLKELSEKGLEGTDAESIFKLNKLAVDFCNKNGAELTDSTTAGKDVMAMFGAMDEQSDFDWVQNPAQAMADGNPNVYAGLNAISMATNPKSPAGQYSVTLDKDSMSQANAYLKMKEAIENGTFTADMAKEQFAAMDASYEASQNPQQESGWNFMEHLEDGNLGFLGGTILGSYMQKDEKPNAFGNLWPWNQGQDAQQQTEGQPDAQAEDQNGKNNWSFGFLHGNGDGFVIDLPGDKDLHIGKTEENQANGTLFGLVGTALDGAGYESPKEAPAEWGAPIGSVNDKPYDTADIWWKTDKDGNIIESKGLNEGHLQTLEHIPENAKLTEVEKQTLLQQLGTNAAAVEVSKGVNTAKPGERGQQAEEMFSAVNEKAAAAQAARQMEEM